MIEMAGEALLNAIREAQQATTAADEVGGLTAEELRTALKMSHNKLRAALQQFAKDGRLKVGKRLAPDVTGRMNVRPTYLLTE